ISSDTRTDSSTDSCSLPPETPAQPTPPCQTYTGEILKERQAACPPPPPRSSSSSSSRRLRDFKETMSSIIHTRSLSSSSSLPSSFSAGPAPKERDWETDSSSSESQAGGSVGSGGRSRPVWRPRREVLNIDGIFTRERRRSELDELQDEVWRRAREVEQQRERERERESAMGFNPTPSKILDLDQLQIQGRGVGAEQCVSEAELHLDQSVRLEKAGEPVSLQVFLTDRQEHQAPPPADSAPISLDPTGRTPPTGHTHYISDRHRPTTEAATPCISVPPHVAMATMPVEHRALNVSRYYNSQNTLHGSPNQELSELDALYQASLRAPSMHRGSNTTASRSKTPTAEMERYAYRAPPTLQPQEGFHDDENYSAENLRRVTRSLSVRGHAGSRPQNYSQDSLCRSRYSSPPPPAPAPPPQRLLSREERSDQTDGSSLDQRYHRVALSYGTLPRAPPTSSSSSLRQPRAPPTTTNFTSSLRRPRPPPTSTTSSSLQQPWAPPTTSTSSLPQPWAPPTTSSSSLPQPWAPPTSTSSLRRPQAPPTSTSSLRRPQAPPTTTSSLQQPWAPPTITSSLRRPRAPPTTTSTLRQLSRGTPNQAPPSALGGWHYATLPRLYRPHPTSTTYPQCSPPTSPTQHTTSPAPKKPQRVDFL
ncbi:hypothetical protein CRUP_026828, partial [Coryphaenoides rupestris]